uniref:Uncharacterized protein n=1 Tax=Arundo donax TaxID=35708 RepID=A0A0A9DHL6_ARUDO
MRVSVSDSGAGVRFGKIFWDIANNTRNPTWVSESDTDAGCLTRQKKFRHGCPCNTAYSSLPMHMKCLL